MVYLIILTLASTAGSWWQTAFPMADMDTCLQAVAASKQEIPQGGDAEGAIAMVCVTSLDGYWRGNDAKWYQNEKVQP